MTQEELARRAGMSLKGMGDIERGGIPDPHYSSLNKIAEGLGVSVGELLEEPTLAGKAEAAAGEPRPASGQGEAHGSSLGLVHRVGVLALGSSAADDLRPVLRDQGEWSRDLAGQMRAARDPLAASRAVAREGDRVEADFDKAVRALRPLREELLAKLGFPADGHGRRAGEEEAGRAVEAFVDALRAGLDASYRGKVSALEHVHEQSKQGVDQGADRRAPQSVDEPQTEHRGMAVTDQRTKKGARRNTKAPKNRNVNG